MTSTTVAAAAQATGVVTSVGFNYRHARAVEHARELVAAGALGRVTNLRAVFFIGYAAALVRFGDDAPGPGGSRPRSFWWPSPAGSGATPPSAAGRRCPPSRGAAFDPADA